MNGGTITLNGGVVLLAAANKIIRLSRGLVLCFSVLRLSAATRHPLADLLRQRSFAFGLEHEDLTDLTALRDDPALAAVLDKPGGQLAGKSTLNRIEHAGLPAFSDGSVSAGATHSTSARSSAEAADIGRMA